LRRGAVHALKRSVVLGDAIASVRHGFLLDFVTPL
jgi:hypothetical protein